jgi:hypothetical protein
LIGHVPEDTIEKSTEPLEVTLERATTGTGIPEPVIEDRAVGEPPSTDSGVRQVRRPTPATVLHTSTEDEDPGATQPGAAASVHSDGREAESAANEGRPYGRLLLVLSAAGVLALVAMGVMQVMRDTDGAHERGSPSVAGATAEAAGPAVDEGDDESGPQPAPAVGTGAAEQTGGDEGEGTGAAATDDADGGRASPVPPTPPPPPATENQTLDLSLADEIEAGSVHVLGHLYVTTRVPTRTTTWDDASEICRGRSVHGVGGWRLPTKSQAYKLRKAGLLESASYWTRSTVGDDEVIAFDGATGRTTVWLKIEPNARAVCVRKRR